MTIEMAQPHSASKSNSASRTADSRFKSTHGKSQADAAGGFQSILSAAADASSEIVATADQSLAQSVKDPIAKDPKSFKDSKDAQTPITPIADPAQLLQGVTTPDHAAGTLTQVATVTEAAPVQSAANLHADHLTAAPALLLQQQSFNTPTKSQSVQVQPPDTSVATAVSALLSQSRFTQSAPQKAVPQQDPAIALVADASPAQQPPTPIAAQALTPLAAASTSAAALASTSQPIIQPSAQPNASFVSDGKKSSPTVIEVASVLSQGRFAATSGSAASPLTSAPRSAVSQGEDPAKPPAKTASNTVTDASAIFALLQAPPSVVANQEMKALEAVKATTTPANAAPIARLAGLDAQEKQGKTAGLNEFKPWSPVSFSSTARMSDTSSGSNAGKDSASNAAVLPTNAATSQSLAPESKLTQWLESNPITPVPADTLIAPAATAALEVLREEHAVFKSNQPDALPDLQSFQLNGVEGSPTVTTAEGAVPLETYVAEQVTYWISQDVQNAELKLEGIGIDPVQVNITMQGNEAFVSFTTDESQAREALENAREQLTEMMLSQGVILSGVSVGSSGAKDSGAQERNPRQGNKQTLVTSVQSEMQENKPRPGRISGSTLDLFV